VPDLDRLPRSVRPAWRQVADAIRGQHACEVVAERIEKAVARTFRRSGGLVWLEDLARGLAEAWAIGTTAPVERAVCQLDRCSATGVGSAFVDAARSLAASGSTVLDPAPDPLTVLVGAGIERMAWKLCLGPLEPNMTPTVFPLADDFAAYADDCIRRVRIERLAADFISSGCTGRMRAPRTRQRSRSTAELLHAPLD
jgi:hypothetical protein